MIPIRLARSVRAGPLWTAQVVILSIVYLWTLGTLRRERECLPQTAMADGVSGSADIQAAAPGVHLPQPSLWPVVPGSGITLLLFGVVTP
jgi:hypothetical protein